MPEQWEGWYTYPAEVYGEKLASKPEAFRLQITYGWFGRFRGTVIEDVTRNENDEPGIIKGVIRGRKISFVKKYPWYYIVTPEGKYVPGKEYLENLYQVQLTWEINPPVSYCGCFNDSMTEASGEWRMEEFIVPTRAGGIFKFPKAAGTWAMKAIANGGSA